MGFTLLSLCFVLTGRNDEAEKQAYHGHNERQVDSREGTLTKLRSFVRVEM